MARSGARIADGKSDLHCLMLEVVRKVDSVYGVSNQVEGGMRQNR